LKLIEERISGLECPAGKKDKLFADDTQPGLYVRVTGAGTKSFMAQYTVSGQKRRVPLGSHPEISLKQARAAASKIMGEKALGLDPAGERKAKALEAKRKEAHEALKLDVLLDQWSALHLAGKRQSYADEAVRALKVAFAKQLPLPAADLDRPTVVRAVDALSLAGKNAMAKSTVRYGSACFAWAVKRGVLASNPFTAIPTAATTKRERVLTDVELRAIWQATAKPGSFNSIVRTLMLTGQRREEVAAMTWSELSEDLATWSLPAARAKNGVAHQIPLSTQVRSILEAAARYKNNQLCFPGDYGPFRGWHRAKDRLDAASGVDGWVLHDLRRTVATGLQRLGVKLEVTEAILNHVSGSRSGIVSVYQRYTYGDEKRAALEAWGARVAEIGEGREPAGNVIAMRASA
jgi:integrase